ncbi:hypothetical protein M899_0226 [Bacteriovorax sp. BSW11_IV]|nr:hypothetical protein M899_0226 [Bacteriovorax sp. BSW11_IV]
MNFFFLFFFLLNQSYAISFSNGDTFTSHKLRGSITILCKDNDHSMIKNTFNCEDEQLFPSSFDYFVDDFLDADLLTISYRDHHGDERDMSLFYDPSNYRSASKVNLWANYSKHPPLLHYGENLLSIKAMKKGLTVRRQNFSVFVEKGSNKTCNNISLFTLDTNECSNKNMACSLYFSSEISCN